MYETCYETQCEREAKHLSTDRSRGSRVLRSSNYVDAITREMSLEEAILGEWGRSLEGLPLRPQSRIQIYFVRGLPQTLYPAEEPQVEAENTEAEPPHSRTDSRSRARRLPRDRRRQREPATDRPKPESYPASTTPRGVFTDGWNSFWHFVEGLFAIRFPLLVPLCVVYQLLDRHDINAFVDIAEFLWGHFTGYLFRLMF